MEAIEVAVTDVNPIAWSRPRPFPFLCFLCGYDEAVTKVTLQQGVKEVNACLCEGCAQLRPDEILAGLSPRRSLRRSQGRPPQAGTLEMRKAA